MSQNATRYRWNVAADVALEIERYFLERCTPAQVHAALEADPRFKGRVPHVRSLQRYAKDVQVPDPSAPWTLASPSPAAADQVLDVLAAVVEETNGRVSSVTQLEAEWISRLRAARPDLPGWECWFLARLYIMRTGRHESTADLDMYLAFAPWRDDEHADRYVDAISAAGIAPALPFIHRGLQSGRFKVTFRDGEEPMPMPQGFARFAEHLSVSAVQKNRRSRRQKGEAE